jgi:hypothetical protein
VEAEFSHADGQTDRRDESNSRFSQFCDRTEKQWNGDKPWRLNSNRRLSSVAEVMNK